MCGKEKTVSKGITQTSTTTGGNKKSTTGVEENWIWWNKKIKWTVKRRRKTQWVLLNR